MCDIDEPQPRCCLSYPPQLSQFRQRPAASADNVDHAAGILVRGQGLVIPDGSVSKGASPGIARSPGSSHYHDSGCMAWHVISHIGNGKWVTGIFAMRLLYIPTTLDREHLDILCKPWSPLTSLKIWSWVIQTSERGLSIPVPTLFAAYCRVLLHLTQHAPKSGKPKGGSDDMY